MFLVTVPTRQRYRGLLALMVALLVVAACNSETPLDRLQRQRLKRQEQERARQREIEHAREIEQAYAQLEETHSELEQAHQNLQITQTQLVQSEKMASLGFKYLSIGRRSER